MDDAEDDHCWCLDGAVVDEVVRQEGEEGVHNLLGRPGQGVDQGVLDEQMMLSKPSLSESESMNPRGECL